MKPLTKEDVEINIERGNYISKDKFLSALAWAEKEIWELNYVVYNTNTSRGKCSHVALHRIGEILTKAFGQVKE